MAVLLFVLCLLALEGAKCDHQQVSAGQSDPLADRLDIVERLLNEQNSLLNEQNSRLLLQEELMVQQAELTQQQHIELLQLKTLVHRQGLELSKQEELLKNQERVITEQNQKVPQQEMLIQQLAAERGNAVEEIDPVNFSDTVNKSSESHNNLGHPHSSHKSVRSDDATLEAVVNQLSQQVTTLSANVHALQNGNVQQSSGTGASTFVHWGSSTCTAASQTVYSGVVGGSYEAHSGGATNYLCLTLSPVFSSHAIPSNRAVLYGGEYQTYDHVTDEHDPVCAVCRSTYSTTVMIPGTNVCTSGWHLQYSGYLMAGNHVHSAGSEFICVDSKLESPAHSEANQNGKLLFFTITHCGSLPCSPYVNNKVVTCAVCSK